MTTAGQVSPATTPVVHKNGAAAHAEPGPRVSRRIPALETIRELFKRGAVEQLGEPAVLLIILVAEHEDRHRYERRILFWNSVLMNALGLKSDSSLRAVRDRAVKAGWLIYERGGKGRQGKYGTTIPPDLSSGQPLDKPQLTSGQPLENVTPSPVTKGVTQRPAAGQVPPSQRPAAGEPGLSSGYPSGQPLPYSPKTSDPPRSEERHTCPTPGVAGVGSRVSEDEKTVDPDHGPKPNPPTIWGDPEAKIRLDCTNRRFVLTTETEDFLRRKFPLARFDDVLTMAADQLCDMLTGRRVEYLNEVRTRLAASQKAMAER